MKTLVNKINPQIRISAPEIDAYEEDQMYYIPVVEGHYCIPMCIDDWTLIEEEPKHTEVWVEGRTIFEQDGEPTEGIKRKVYPTLTGADKEDAEHYFPELKESEDERIRKAIREILLDAPAQDLINKDLELEKALAWLEKQKDSVSNAKYIEDVAHAFEDGRKKGIEEKQKEQKSISAEEILVKAGLKPYKDGNQWCILAGDNIQEGICGFGDTIEDALYEFLKEVLDLQKKQKPVEWSEEDENKLNHILEIVHIASGREASVDEKEELESFLKSLRPQPQQEWSEDDEEMFDEALAGVLLARNRMNDTGCIGLAERFEKAYKWLESFRHRPHWKPSEEQKPEAKLTGWVARDGNEEIWVYGAHPERVPGKQLWIESNSMRLDQKSFPDLKWAGEPMEVEITIRKK